MAMLPLLAFSVLALAQLPPAPSTAPPDDRVVVTLPDLVRVASTHELTTQVGRILPQLADAEVLSALSVFDPRVTVSAGWESQSTHAGGVSTTPLDNTTASYGASWTAKVPGGGEYRVGLDGTVARSDPFDPARSLFSSTYANGLSVAFSQPILRGAGSAATAAVRVAQDEVEAAAPRFERQLDRMAADVEIAYYGLAYAEAAADLAHRALDAARAVHDRNVQLRMRDLATELDVLSSERLVASREMAVLQADQRREDAAQALVFLVWGDDAAGELARRGIRIRTDANALTPEIPDLTTPVEDVLARRADVRAARVEVGRAERGLDLARNLGLPDVSLVGSLSQTGTAPQMRYFSFGDSLTIRDLNWSLGVRLALPIKNRFASAQEESAAVEVSSAKIALAARESAVRDELLTARRAVTTAVERRAKAEQVADAATRLYDAAERSVLLGVITTFELIRYDEDLANSRLLAVQADYELAAAVTQTKLAEGALATSYGLDTTVSARPPR
jgi:outer membrane protein TolC